jgi:hypothetical protein
MRVKYASLNTLSTRLEADRVSPIHVYVHVLQATGLETIYGTEMGWRIRLLSKLDKSDDV